MEKTEKLMKKAIVGVKDKKIVVFVGLINITIWLIKENL